MKTIGAVMLVLLLVFVAILFAISLVNLFGTDTVRGYVSVGIIIYLGIAIFLILRD